MKNKKTDMKTVRRILFLAGMIFVSACSKYLDVVPDNTMKLEDIFVQRSEAINALAKVYSYIPHIDDVNVSSFLLGDEYIGILNNDILADKLRSIRIMRGLQSTSDPHLGTWSGTGGAKDLYEGIRQANVFLQYSDQVYDMMDSEKAEWNAQVTFLKAYYHFLLLQQYGPIVIVDNLIDPAETSKDVLFPKRSKIEDCFDYIINLMDEAIPKLRERVTQLDYGQVDQVAAKAIKARVLLFRASPFFNGNRDIFGDFYDLDGQQFFPQTYDKEKWKDAIDAINDAITICKNNDLDLYKNVKGIYYRFDTAALAVNFEKMQILYNLRMVVVDPWNEELVWGLSNLYHYDDGGYERQDELAHVMNIRLPPNPAYSGNGNAEKNSHFASGQWLAASYKMLERYYTKNGLPIDEDPEFDQSKKYGYIVTPGVDAPEYVEYAGIMQPGIEVPNLYMDRELRFYANLGITGGYYRAHRYRINTTMFYNDEGGRSSSTYPDEYLATGIGIQKLVHPESGSGWAFWQIKFPYPIIRMADLYLMKAEALNEYYDAPTQEVYDAINIVRRRAGIPDVEVAWANAKTANKHANKDGMRDIILQERGIELAFEGSRYWDMIRHKRAPSEFSGVVTGWNTMGSTSRTFFVLDPKQTRRFTATNYLWPIDLNEINTNRNLIQNPGW
jgi:hypothetical protein